MNEANTSQYTDRHRRRNFWVGLITLLILLGLLVVGIANKRRQAAQEARLVHRADVLTVQALAGRCALFSQAEQLYKQAMRFHLQSRDLVGKASLCAALSGYCGQDVQPLLASRLKLLENHNAQPGDIKALLELQLAAGNPTGALATAARFPNDSYCRWLSEWLEQLSFKKQGDIRYVSPEQ